MYFIIFLLLLLSIREIKKNKRVQECILQATSCPAEQVCEIPEKRVIAQCMEPLRKKSMSDEKFDSMVNKEWKKFFNEDAVSV
jgi:hypothetical protein